MAKRQDPVGAEGLSLRHLAFARLVVGGSSAAEAYRLTYPNASKATAETNGPALLRGAQVSAFVDKIRAKAAKKVEVTEEYVLESLLDVSKRCRSAVPVMVREGRNLVQKTDEDGEGVWEFDSAGANRSLELLGKHLKMFTEKVELDANVRTHAELIAEAHRRLAARPKPDGGEE